MTSLYEISASYRLALTGLAEMELPAEAVADTLEGLSGDFIDKGRAVAAFMLNLEAEADMIKQAEQRMAARRKAIENHAGRMREYLRESMASTGISKIDCAEFSVRLGKPAKIVQCTEDLLPCEFLITKTAPNKTAIARALKAGEIIPGAYLADGKSRLLIR